MVVLRRSIVGFRAVEGVTLTPHSAPTEFALAPVGPHGEPVAPLAARLAVAHSSIARRLDGRVARLRVGNTRLRVNIGSCELAVAIQVTDTLTLLSAPDMQLVAVILARTDEGGAAALELPAEHYRVRRLLTGVVFPGAKCARGAAAICLHGPTRYAHLSGDSPRGHSRPR
jgi:hypothetical protein